jgi:hypothetical protein
MPQTKHFPIKKIHSTCHIPNFLPLPKQFWLPHWHYTPLAVVSCARKTLRISTTSTDSANSGCFVESVCKNGNTPRKELMQNVFLDLGDVPIWVKALEDLAHARVSRGVLHGCSFSGMPHNSVTSLLNHPPIPFYSIQTMFVFMNVYSETMTSLTRIHTL